jgi:UDP-glucose 4-epimerase
MLFSIEKTKRSRDFMARVVVTGGAGFIGSHIVERFIASGHKVTVIDDLSSGTRQNLFPEADFIEMDIRSPEIRSVLGKIAPEIVVHTAAQMSVRKSMEDPTFDADVNVVGLVNILQSFPLNKLPFFVFLSTGGAIYGEQDTFPANEQHACKPTSIYGLAKRVGEMYLDFWGRELGLKHAELRLGNVYGPRQNPHGEAGVVAIFNKKLLANQVPVINGTGEQTRDFVYVGDVARAVDLVATKSVQGIFNIGTGRETSVNLLYTMITKALQSPIKATYGEAKVGEQMRSSIDATQAQKTFSWKPEVSLEVGCQKTSDWFRTNG